MLKFATILSSLFRTLPKFKGKNRIARVLLKRTISESLDVSINGRYKLTYKVPNVNESIGFELFINGIYEFDNIKLIINKIPKNGVFIDVGANIGSIAIPIAKLRPDIKVFAIEASPRVFSYLKYNVKVNKCENVILLNKAMAEIDNKIVSFYSPKVLFGKGSLLPIYTDIPENISTITLDSLVVMYGIKLVDFIKIDVEGFEKNVLNGGQRILSQERPPKILFEFSDFMEDNVEDSNAGDAQDLLRNLKYALYNVSDPKKEPMSMPYTIRKGFAMILAEK
jgi:FkbM family methyltransferase